MGRYCVWIPSIVLLPVLFGVPSSAKILQIVSFAPHVHIFADCYGKIHIVTMSCVHTLG